MRYFAAALLLAMVPSTAFGASVCTSAKMSVYDATSFSCQLGDYIFSNFAYSYTLGSNEPAAYASAGLPAGLGVLQPDTAVTVTPSLADGIANLDFSGSWVADHYQIGTLNIGFTVTMAAHQLNTISATYAQLADAGHKGLVTDSASASPSGTPAAPGTSADFINPATGTGTLTYSPTVEGPVALALHSVMDARGNPTCVGCSPINYSAMFLNLTQQTGIAHLSDVKYVFSETKGVIPPPTTPEPASAFLMLGGGTLLVAFRRLKARKG
jgi:hypothetical protein